MAVEGSEFKFLKMTGLYLLIHFVSDDAFLGSSIVLFKSYKLPIYTLYQKYSGYVTEA